MNKSLEAHYGFTPRAALVALDPIRPAQDPEPELIEKHAVEKARADRYEIALREAAHWINAQAPSRAWDTISEALRTDPNPENRTTQGFGTWKDRSKNGLADLLGLREWSKTGRMLGQ